MVSPIYDKLMSDTLDNRLAHHRILVLHVRGPDDSEAENVNVAVKFELVESHKQPPFSLVRRRERACTLAQGCVEVCEALSVRVGLREAFTHAQHLRFTCQSLRQFFSRN